MVYFVGLHSGENENAIGQQQDHPSTCYISCRQVGCSAAQTNSSKRIKEHHRDGGTRALHISWADAAAWPVAARVVRRDKPAWSRE